MSHVIPPTSSWDSAAPLSASALSRPFETSVWALSSRHVVTRATIPACPVWGVSRIHGDTCRRRKTVARRLEVLPDKFRTVPPGAKSSEDPPDATEETGVLGHHLIELAEVQPHPLAARALVQLDAPIRDGD